MDNNPVKDVAELQEAVIVIIHNLAPLVYPYHPRLCRCRRRRDPSNTDDCLRIGTRRACFLSPTPAKVLAVLSVVANHHVCRNHHPPAPAKIPLLVSGAPAIDPAPIQTIRAAQRRSVNLHRVRMPLGPTGEFSRDGQTGRELGLGGCRCGPEDYAGGLSSTTSTSTSTSTSKAKQ